MTRRKGSPLLWFFVSHCLLMVSAGSALNSWAHLLYGSGWTIGLSGIDFFNRGRPLRPCLSSDIIGSPFSVTDISSTVQPLSNRAPATPSSATITNNRSHCILVFFSLSQGRRLEGWWSGFTKGRPVWNDGAGGFGMGYGAGKRGFGNGNLLLLFFLLGRVWVV